MNEYEKPEKSYPKLYEHCETVYNAMAEEAEWKELYDQQRLVYEGYLTKLFRRIGLSVPQYSHVKKELERMGCIRQLRRGGGSSPSVWVLIEPPSKEKFDNEKVNPLFNSRGGLRKTAFEVLQSQFDDLRRQYNQLELRVKELENG